MTRASGPWSRIVGGVEQDEQPIERGRPKGSRAVIDPHAAARLSAVVRDGEFDEHAADGGAGRGPRGFGGARPTVLRAVPATAVATLAIACLWTSGRDFREFPRRSTHAAPAGGSFGSPRAAAGPMFGAGGDPDARDGDQAMSAKNRMRAAVVAAAAATGSALAQDAVQWRVEDGGNGHWYQFIETTNPRTWQPTRNWAQSIGAHLATITSAEEQTFIISIAPQFQDESGGQAWLGGYQDRSASDFSEPHGGWRWVTGEPMTYQPWVHTGSELAYSDFLTLAIDVQGRFGWNDIPTDYMGGRRFCFVEFDADCNSDGIVDYGQIRASQLPDGNANGVPDCCESDSDCCIGDIYRDGVINGADLGIVLADWGPAVATKPSDLDGNGRVDGADLGMLLANWGACGG
jgi:hypothetical protein